MLPSAMAKPQKRSRSRRGRASARTDRPLLAVTMMVKDEEVFLEDALRSAQPWADELLVMDTGSTDRTVEIAEDLGATVSHFAWCDDFSAARNETLRRSTARWNLILDADERLRGGEPAKLRRLLEATSTGYPFQVLMLKVVNTSLAGQVLSTLSSVRIIPNDPALGYTARVHNVFGSLDRKRKEIHARRYDDLEIVHLGYDPEVYRRRKKAARSLPLIEAAVAEDPDNLLHRYYLGREYFALGRYGEAIEVLEHTVRRLSAGGGGAQDVLRDSWWHLIQAMRNDQRALTEVLAVSKDALAVFPMSADLWFVSASALADAGQLEEASRYFVRTLGAIEAEAQAGGVAKVRHVADRSQDVHHRLAVTLADLGKLPEAYASFLQAVDTKPIGEAGWSELINCALGLAIDLGDGERLVPLLERLLDVPDAPLDLLFLLVEQQAAAGDAGDPRGLLEQARAHAPRVGESPAFAEWAARLGID